MLTLTLPSLAVALTHPSADLGTVHGWTADGAVVYGLDVHDHYEPAVVQDASDLEPGTVHHIIVQRGDAIAHDWVIGADLPNFAKGKAPPSEEAAWLAWRAANPLVAAVAGRAGPSGVHLEVTGGPQIACTADACEATTFMYGEDGAEPPTAITVGLSNGGKGHWTLATAELATSAWSSALTSTVRPAWASDGARVAVAVQSPTQMTMRGPSFGSVDVVVYPSSPLVSVLAPKALGDAVSRKVATAIAGLGVVETGEAKAARDASVVYFAAGHEDAAKAIAAKVPGGATVEPMTWDAHQHVVVAVGASAR